MNPIRLRFVDGAVEDGVGKGRDCDPIVPLVDGNLAGDDERALVVAVLIDFEEIARLLGGADSCPQLSRISSFARAKERRSRP